VQRRIPILYPSELSFIVFLLWLECLWRWRRAWWEDWLCNL